MGLFFGLNKASGSVPPPPEENILLTNLEAYWKLDESSGAQLMDSHTNNLDSASNSTTSTTGKLNGCISCDGTQYASFGNNLNFERTDAFSFSVWVYRDSANTLDTVISKMESTGAARGYLFMLRNSGAGIKPTKLHFGLRSDSATLNQFTIFGEAGDIYAGEWYHVGVTYDGSSVAAGVKFYVNGQPEEIYVYDDNLTGTIVSTANLCLGARPTSTTQYMNGKIDEVGIWSRVLTATEMNLLYNSGKGFAYESFQ